jgi:hypothetical protein
VSNYFLKAIGVEVGAGDVRGAFDAAYDAADAQETRQRLEGLTKALPVARIQPPAIEEERARWHTDRQAMMAKIGRQRREIRNMNRALREAQAARWAAVQSGNQGWKAYHDAHVSAVRAATPWRILGEWYRYRSGQTYPCVRGWRYLAWLRPWQIRRAIARRPRPCAS